MVTRTNNSLTNIQKNSTKNMKEASTKVLTKETKLRYPGRVREHLANERTYLSWMRSAISLVGYQERREYLPKSTGKSFRVL